MCCGQENIMIENQKDVRKLLSSAIRKKRYNRNRRHPSMCVDAVLASTINLLKNNELTKKILDSKILKRASTFPTDRLRRKKSRWDMKTRESKTYDEELEKLTGMDSFFEKLREVSRRNISEQSELVPMDCENTVPACPS